MIIMSRKEEHVELVFLFFFFYNYFFTSSFFFFFFRLIPQSSNCEARNERRKSRQVSGDKGHPTLVPLSPS